MKLILLLISFIGGIAGYGSPPPPPPPCNTPQCLSGSYCFSSTNACTDCPPGYIYNANPNVGVSSVSLWGCSICPSGTFSSSTGSGSCSPCSSGYFSSNAGSSGCTGCPSGTFASSPGSSGCSGCSNCPTGTFVQRSCSSTSDIVCASCASIANCGTTPTCTSASNSQCASCSSGYYFASVNNCLACTICQNGLTYETAACSTYTNRQCAFCLTICSVGQMLSGTCAGITNKVCITCPTSYYKSLADGSNCLPCTSTCNPGFQLNPLCSPVTNSICIPCSIGYYKSLADGSSCQACTNNCSPGFQLNQPCTATVNPLCIPCSSGYYKSLADGSSCQVCTNSCNPGFQLNQPCNSIVNPLCIPCSIGYYKSLADGSSCQVCTNNCSPGFQLNQPCITTVNPLCIPCSTNYYKSLADDSSCQPCLNDCAPGAYLIALCSSTANPSCALCPPNTANPNHFSVFISSCVTCPNGAISASGSATCLQCPLGKATFSTINCTNCDTGTYADNLGSITCKTCPAGTANNQLAAQNINQCIQCNPGYYSNPGASICSACLIGTYNENNNCSACPVGTYNNLTAQTTCALCPAGSASLDIGAINITTCIICSPGSFSSVGSAACSLCPPGTSSNTSGSSICSPNPLGTYTNLSGSISPISCSHGYYSENSGNINCTPCPVGFFNNKTGSFQNNDCLDCPPGFYAPAVGSIGCLITIRGFFQDLPRQSSYLPCPVGTANNNIGSTSSMACVACSPGKYQYQTGSSVCIPCPAGYFQNNSGQIDCLPCPAGTYNSNTDSNSLQSCLPCPVGTYSSSVGANTAFTCIITPIGTYTNITGSVNYTLCNPGTFQNGTNQTACLLCPAGTYNSLYASNNNSACLSASPGFYTYFNGSASSIPCSIGSFINTTGKTSCQLCSPGTFINTIASTSCLPCPMETFALGTGFSNCDPIDVPVITSTSIYANSVTVIIQTNFTATFSFIYSCSDTCNISINNISTLVANTQPMINSSIVLKLRLGIDIINIIYTGTFQSSLTSEFTCEIINNMSYCSTIPPNKVIENVILITTRDPINTYADPAINFTSELILAASLNQNYKFYLTNLEAAVTYSLQVIFDIIYQTEAFIPIELGKVTTKPSVPTAPVQDLTKYFLGINIADQANNEQSNLQIHWEPPFIIAQHGEIIGYTVDYEQQERSFITYGSNVNVLTTPSKSFSVFTNETTFILSGLIPDTIYDINVYPMTEANGLGPKATIQLKTQVSAPPNPPVLTLVEQKATNITVSWSSLTNETGIITKVWIVAEPYTLNLTSAMVVHIPINNSDLLELPFPHEGIKGFFASYNASNPCDEHIKGYTFHSRFSNVVCGGICNIRCEYGTPMLDPTTILPTNDQNLTNDNYYMEFNDTNGNHSVRMVPYLSMKKRFIINSTNGGLLGGGKIILGDGKINSNSQLNNTVIDPNLFYRIRLIVFTSETLYAISDPLDIFPFQPPSTSDMSSSVFIGIGLAIVAIIFALCIFICLKKYLIKNTELKMIQDEKKILCALLTEKKTYTSTYLNLKNDKDYITVYDKLDHEKPTYAKPTYAKPTYKDDMYPPPIYVSNETTYLDVSNHANKDNWLNEDLFAVPSKVLYTETSEELFEVPYEILSNNSISNPNYFSPNSYS